MEYNGAGFVELSEENIYKKISEYDIFSYYIPEFTELNTHFSSPLRSDSEPSCSIQSWNGTLFYKDFGTKDSFTAINFVKYKFNVHYYNALRIISNDFNLGLTGEKIEKSSMGYIGVSNPNIILSDNKPTNLRIKRRKWNNTIDKEYWSEYGYDLPLLRHLNIVPISHLWLNGKCFKMKENEPSYAYILDNGIYKILSPFSKYKWITNGKANHIQGWHQLPKTGELLIITKSLKDIGLLYKYGYTACAPQSENTLIPIDIISELKDRFKKIVIYFDNDEPGIDSAQLYESLFEVDYVHNPIDDPKDISDYYKMWGDNPTKQLLKELL